MKSGKEEEEEKGKRAMRNDGAGESRNRAEGKRVPGEGGTFVTARERRPEARPPPAAAGGCCGRKLRGTCRSGGASRQGFLRGRGVLRGRVLSKVAPNSKSK